MKGRLSIDQIRMSDGTLYKKTWERNYEINHLEKEYRLGVIREILGLNHLSTIDDIISEIKELEKYD